MPLYTKQTEDGAESEYEDEGICYHPGEEEAAGAFDRVRSLKFFKQSSDSTLLDDITVEEPAGSMQATEQVSDSDHVKIASASKTNQGMVETAPQDLVVLSPVNPDKQTFIQACTKLSFFRFLHGKDSAYLFFAKDEHSSYRLVLKRIPGETFANYFASQDDWKNKAEEQLKILHLCLLQIKRLHDNGMVILDLKEDGITYEKETGKVFLLDGGSHQQVGSLIADNFQCYDLSDLAEQQKNLTQAAPESHFLVDGIGIQKNHPRLKRPRVTCAMDIYSIGTMFNRLLSTRGMYEPLRIKMAECANHQHNQRPTLQALIDWSLSALETVQRVGAYNHRLVQGAGPSRHNNYFRPY